MKKILIYALCLAMLLVSLSTLTSCEKAVKEINGLSAQEAYVKAIQSLDSIDKYSATTSMKVQIKLWVLPVYTLSIDDFYFYSYEGDNIHCGFTEEGKDKLIEEEMQDVLYDVEDEMWYYDGVCYYIDGSYKGKFSSATSPIYESEYEIAVSNMLESVGDECECYKKGDQYYFTVTITDSSLMEFDSSSTKEEYTVYFNEDGYITRIEIVNEHEGFASTTMSANYYYGDEAEGVKLPENIDSFIED